MGRSNREFENANKLYSSVWKSPSAVIDSFKPRIKARNELVVERTAECVVPLNVIRERDADKHIVKTEGSPKGITWKVTVAAMHESMFKMYVYGDRTTGEEHIALVKDLGDGKRLPVRVHSSCLTAESFYASNCDCREQLDMAISLIDKIGKGMVIWLHQEGRGNGLVAKAKQLDIMMRDNIDTVAAFEKAGYPGDRRDYTAAADILRDLGVSSIRLISNNPDKSKQMIEAGINIVGRIPSKVMPKNEIVRRDLRAKARKMGHKISWYKKESK